MAPPITQPRRVFLAHAHEDKERVRALYEQITQRGFSPWLDEKDLISGQIWETEIQKAIREAGAFIACLSHSSVQKEGYVQTEFRLALTAYGEKPPGAIYFIPVRLDECKVPDLQIPNRGLSIRDFYWLDLWQEGGFERLIQALEMCLGTTVRAMLKPGTVFRDIDAPWCPEMVALSACEFMMGSLETDKDTWSSEKPQHQVVIGHRLAIGRYPITVGEYRRFVEATDHSHAGGLRIWHGSSWKKEASKSWRDPGFQQMDRHPVVGVSWRDAQGYVNWLARETGRPYRLPTEAEWEYSCRAGTTTHYSFGNTITPEDANYAESKLGKTTEVGSFPPNRWGLYDMHGNVWEWVEDVWHESYEGAPADSVAWTDDKGTKSSSTRVLRGGSWNYGSTCLRSAFRNWLRPALRVSGVGFRVARALD